MTSSNHSSTESADSTGADDHFVESVFDAGADQADVGDLVDHPAPPDPGPDGAAADPDGLDDESEDLDVVADELARAAKMLADHPGGDPSLLADLDLAAAVGPESEPAPAPEPAAPLLTDHERPAQDLAAELAKQAGVDLEAARTTVEFPGPLNLDAPGSDQPPVPPAPPVPVAVPPPVPAPAPAPPPLDTPSGAPIDQVAVRKLGGFNFLSVAQWAGLPRDERARLLKGGLVQFLYEGDEVPAREALQWLQRLARADAQDPDDPPRRGSRR